MIEEESLFPMKSIFLLIMIVVLLAVIAFAVWLFFNIGIEVNVRALDRATVEISDAISKSPLTEELAIFKEEELEKYKDTRTEPYIQHCRYGYFVKIKTAKKEWRFGYEPESPVKSEKDSKSKFPVAVLSNGKIEPAEMEIRMYDTWTTRIACMIEAAYQQKKIQEEKFNCPGYLRSHYGLCGFLLRRQNGDSNSDYICMFFMDGDKKIDTDCRYLPGIPIGENLPWYRDKEDRLLLAVPVKKQFVDELKSKNIYNSFSFVCGEPLDDILPKENEEVGEVVICAEPIGER